MKIKQILVAFLFATLVISCGKKAKDIIVSEITTTCGMVDAYEIVGDEMLALAEAVDSEEGASEVQIKEWDSLLEKGDEIEKHSKKLEDKGLIKESDVEDCSNWKTLENKMEKLSKIEVLGFKN